MTRLLLVATLLSGVIFNVAAQRAKTVSLQQTPGVFQKTELKLKAGKTYVFEVENKGIDHEVGFVLAPEGKTEAKHHIQTAYLKSTVKDGESAQSNEVVLEAGRYVYFCPLNPTPKYTLIVEE